MVVANVETLIKVDIYTHFQRYMFIYKHCLVYCIYEYKFTKNVKTLVFLKIGCHGNLENLETIQKIPQFRFMSRDNALFKLKVQYLCCV